MILIIPICIVYFCPALCSGAFLHQHPISDLGHTWLTVLIFPGPSLVDVGDLLTQFTNRVYTSAQHQVLAPTRNAPVLYSVLRSGHPEYIIAVLPLSEEWAQGKGKGKEAGSGVRKWEPITVSAYLALKFQQSKDSGKKIIAA